MSQPVRPESIEAIEQLPIPAEIREDMLKLIGLAGGAVWSRSEALDVRTRSLATMGILSALGRSDELAIHVRLGQQEFGVTRQEICELMMHTAVYAGFPASISALRVASRVFSEMDAESSGGA